MCDNSIFALRKYHEYTLGWQGARTWEAATNPVDLNPFWCKNS